MICCSSRRTVPRSRLLKAPAELEPPISECADTVIAVISAKAIGKRVTDNIAHRVDRVTAIAGVYENEKIMPIHHVSILVSNEGALKNTGTTKVIPLINMIDNKETEQLARQTAMEALSMTDRFDYAVLAVMRNTDPMIDIVYR